MKVIEANRLTCTQSLRWCVEVEEGESLNIDALLQFIRENNASRVRSNEVEIFAAQFLPATQNVYLMEGLEIALSGHNKDISDSCRLRRKRAIPTTSIT
jgi:hypothetical protein